MKRKSAIIIGGGVIGAFTAYYLSKKGWTATVVDRGPFGSGSSEGNCGLIVPTHILPLNMLGTIVKALLGMFSKDAPLHVKPRFDRQRIEWFYQFARKCGRANVLSAASGRHALLQSSWGLYPSIMDVEKLECNWQPSGCLHVYRTEKEFEAYRQVDIFLRDYGIAAEPLDREELVRFEPCLRTDLYGGWYYRQTAHLHPERLMEAMHRLLLKKGVTIIENKEVSGFYAQNDRAMGVVAGGKRIPAAVFVVAAGAWTPQLQKELGCRIPIQPGKGYSITTQRPASSPARPCFFEEKSVVATPWTDGFRLGGTMEFSGFDDSLNKKRLNALLNGNRHYLQDPTVGPVEKEWCGFRPMTYDGLPIIDRSPRLKNVTIAAGHNMLGLSMAPGTGKLVAEMLNGEAPHIDPKPYALKRFEKKHHRGRKVR